MFSRHRFRRSRYSGHFGHSGHSLQHCLNGARISSPTTYFPIESLPTELVLEIFAAAMQESPISYDSLFNDPAPPGPVSPLCLSHVCKRWREISLNHGHLWASSLQIDKQKPIWFDELVRRSKEAPLPIESHMDPDMDIWAIALSHLSKWKEVKIQSTHTQQAVISLLVHAAPQLESFQLLTEYDHPLVLPPDAFAGYAPRLRTFSISNVYLALPFKFSIFKNLITLEVRQCHLVEGKRVRLLSAGEWLKVLGGMSQLEYLMMEWTDDNSIPGLADAQTQSMPDIQLEHLRTLRLVAYGEGEVLFNIFSKLAIPPTCDTSILVKVRNEQATSQDSFNKLVSGVNKIIRQWRALDRPLQFSLISKKAECFIVGLPPAMWQEVDEYPPLWQAAFSFEYEHTCDLETEIRRTPAKAPFSSMIKALNSMSSRSTFERIEMNLFNFPSVDLPMMHKFLSGFENIKQALIHVVNKHILSVLASMMRYNVAKKRFQKGNLKTVIFPNLMDLSCIAKLKDFSYINSYVNWRWAHIRKPDGFELYLNELLS